MNLMVKMERGLVHVWTSTGRIFAFVGVCLFAAVGFAAESIAITARPRYPWNGKVDLKFTIDGTSGTKYDTSFTAKDLAGGTNLTMKTLYKSDGTAANVAKEQLLPGTYNWVWDATADLGEGTVLEKVVVEGNTVYNEADAKRYMIVDLKSGAVSYMASVPSGGWTNDPYRQTKWAFQRVEAGSFVQSSGSKSKRTVKISKPYYISLHPFTSYHGNSVACSWMYDVVYGLEKDTSGGWPKKTDTVMFSDNRGYSPNRNLLSALTTISNTGDYEGLVHKLNKLTGKTFSVPTEAQLTKARVDLNLGTTAIFSRDWYVEDLGSSSVTDPCAAYSSGTLDSYSERHMAFVTQSGRGMVYNNFANGSRVCVKLCLEIK